MGTFEDIERKCSNSNSHHRFGMVKELDGLSVERKVIQALVEKELKSTGVQLQRKRFQERYIVSDHFLVREVKSMYDEIVDVIVREKVIPGVLVGELASTL
jgi:hypothetical protein